MTNSLFTLNRKDFFNGMIVAVAGSVFAMLYGLLQTPEFNLMTANWGLIGSQMLQVAVTSFMGYLSKNLFSDQNSNLLGKVKFRVKTTDGTTKTL